LLAAHAGSQLQGITAEQLATLPPGAEAAYAASIAAGVAAVFRVAAFVAAAGFLLTWFIPALPLRETVAAASASAGKDAGEAPVCQAPAIQDPRCCSASRSLPTATRSANT
jgi:hypothetical protein